MGGLGFKPGQSGFGPAGLTVRPAQRSRLSRALWDAAYLIPYRLPPPRNPLGGCTSDRGLLSNSSIPWDFIHSRLIQLEPFSVHEGEMWLRPDLSPEEEPHSRCPERGPCFPRKLLETGGRSPSGSPGWTTGARDKFNGQRVEEILSFLSFSWHIPCINDEEGEFNHDLLVTEFSLCARHWTWC